MPTHIEGAAMMAPVCYTRIFLILRLKQAKAYELFDLGDDNARKDGLAVLRMMVDQRDISTWVRLKGCVALSFHVSNLEEAAMYLRDARRLYDQVLSLPEANRSDPRLVAQLPAIAVEIARSRMHIVRRFIDEKGDGEVHG
ncbi:hypothetical protein NpPPO83_00011574 [Neofusicoccum parvum]|uniref:Uncharacterized protein n=1 Tax=Neofusicoccum parvum TaxID=310453 RepID=A0ACB5SEZ4_9PEZI|nr:hypothetical protein NpPPO83_00011574 [Neofusicoccum parvum]